MKKYIDIDDAWEVVYEHFHPFIFIPLDKAKLSEHELTALKTRLELMIERFNVEFGKEICVILEE